MNFLERIFYKFATRNNGKTLQLVPQWVRKSFLPVSLGRLLDGYQKNSAVAACVTALAFSFPEPPLLPGYEQDGRFVVDYDHELLQLIRQPNLDMSETEFMQTAVVYAAVGGNAYFWKQRSVNGRVVRLWPFSDVNITPLPGRDTSEGYVRGYEYDPGDGHKTYIPKEDIIHWKWMPDPNEPWRGIGAVEFALRDSDRSMEADAYIYALLKNNAVPPVVVTLSEGDELTEAKARRLRSQWNAKMGGEQRGNLAFLEYGMRAEKLGFDLQQLAGEALSAVPEARIAAAFRVPPVVAGLNVGLKRSDYGDKAARKSFTELTLMALWRSLEAELLSGLRDDFNLAPNFRLKFDLRAVGALQEEESKRWERVTMAFERGLLTRAEAKQALGMAPQAGDDVYKVSLATEFLSANGSGERVRSAKGLPAPVEHKSGVSAGETLQRIRMMVAGRMETAVDAYFAQLASKVTERLQSKAAIEPESLLTPEDNAALEALIKRYYAEILSLSWEQWDVMLGMQTAFDLHDPVVAQVLESAGTRVKEIQQTTLEALRKTLVYGEEHQWGIDELVHGDPEAGVAGIEDIIKETYKGRARSIARTELGTAQNQATAARFRESKVSQVRIYDNGETDDDGPCKEADGQIWTLDYFSEHLLEHPRCTRAAAPDYSGKEPDRR